MFLFLVLFLLLPSLVGGLRILGGIIHGLGLLDRFRLFDPGILHGSAFDLHLSRGSVSGSIALLGLVVHLPDVKNKLEACFGPSLNHLLDYLFPGI